MKYYKIIQDNTFIGVVTSDNFVRLQMKHRVFISTDEVRGEFVEYKNKLYRDLWMAPSAYDLEGIYEIADVIEITKEYYDQFKEAIDNNIEIDDNDYDGTIVIPTPIDPNEQLGIDFLRQLKLKEISYTCRQTIESGFDMILRGETCHFSLTTQDQFNLMSLKEMAATSQLIPYHADGEECVFYTPEEINEIISAANNFKTYQITYHNALKGYVNALETIEEIATVEYGMDIPEEYKTNVLKVLES